MISLYKAAIILYLLISSTASGQDNPEFAIPPLDSGEENIISYSSTPGSPTESIRQNVSEGLTPISALVISRDTQTDIFNDDEVSVSISNLGGESGQVRSDGSTSSRKTVGFSDNIDSALFLSFDISDIPKDAQINDVDLEFEELDMVGSPFSSLGCLNIYPASYGSLRSVSYSGRSAVTPYARICNSNRLHSQTSSSSLRRALSSSLGEDRFQLRLQFEREMRSESVPPRDGTEPQPGGGNRPDAPSGNGPVDFRDVIFGDISDLSPFLSQPQTPEVVIRSIESNRSLLQDDLAEYKDDIKKALNPGKVRIAQTQDAPSVEETNICYVDGKIGVWRFDGDDVPYCDITYPLSCPEGQMLDSGSGSCCQDSNENEICDYGESHLIYIGAARLIISYRLPVPIPEPPTIPPPVPSPPIEEGAPDLGSGYFEPPRPSSLIDATPAGWGEVPANQVLVAMDSRMSFQDAREEARRLASDLGGSVVGEFEYLNLFQIETESRTLSDLRGDINFARGYESADLAFPNLQLYREIPPSGMIYPGESGRGYQVIGVEEAWNAIYNDSASLFEVRVGIIDDGLFPGRGQFNDTDIDTSIELYPGAPLNLLAERRLPDYEITGSHGTGIASILTANPSSGLVGIAFLPLSREGNLKVYMINVFDVTDRSFLTSSLLGFKEEIERGSTILSCSLGYTGDPEGTAEAAVLYEDFFRKLSVDYPRILFIFSAGNDGLEIEGDERIPSGRAGYLPNVITVGNIFNNGTLVPSSNRNKDNQYVTLAAPGEEAVWGIYDNESLWNLGGGTSMAAPQVAAAAALIRSINPLLEGGEIKDILKNTAHYDIEGNSLPPELGGIALNIDRAVKKAIHERPPQIEIFPDETTDIEIPEEGDDGNGIIVVRPDASPSPAGYARVTISSATSKGYSVMVDGLIAGKDGIDGDAFDGIYTLLVTGNQRHTIKAASQFNQKEWPETFYSAGSTYVYAF